MISLCEKTTVSFPHHRVLLIDQRAVTTSQRRISHPWLRILRMWKCGRLAGWHVACGNHGLEHGAHSILFHCIPSKKRKETGIYSCPLCHMRSTKHEACTFFLFLFSCFRHESALQSEHMGRVMSPPGGRGKTTTTIVFLWLAFFHPSLLY